MRYVILVAGVTLLLAACGGGSKSVPNELKDVCTQGDSEATSAVQVVSPKSGDQVRSPLALNANVSLEQPILYIAIVTASGTHVADYPGRPQTGTAVPFQQNVPFGIEEQTAACLWVSPTSGEDPPDAIRIPITLLPGGSR